MKRSLLIFDDHCPFCCKRAEAFQKNKDYSGIQIIGRSQANKFLSEAILKKCSFNEEIHLIEPDGSIFRGGYLLHRLFSNYVPRTVKYRLLSLKAVQPFLVVGYKIVARFRLLLGN